MAKHAGRLKVRQAWIGSFFLLPFLIHFSIFVIYPFFSTIFTSFTNQDMLTMQNAYVGIKNYVDVMKDSLFLRSLSNTIFYVLIDGTGVVVFGLAMALVLNMKIKGISFFRTAYYIPVLVDWVIVSLVFMFILDPSFGLLNYFLRLLSIPAQRFLTDPKQALWIITISSIWKGVGYYAVFYLAALQDVPIELKEAAQIDGANKVQSFFKITLPQIMPVSLFVILMAFIGSLKGFDQFYIMTKGGPARSTTTIMYYFYETAFGFLKTGKGSSIAVIFTLFVFLFVGIQRLLLNRLSGSSGMN